MTDTTPPPRDASAPRASSATRALLLACLFFVPLAPLVGLALGLAAVARGGAAVRRPALAAVAIGAVVSLLQLWLLRTMVSDTTIAPTQSIAEKWEEGPENVRRIEEGLRRYLETRRRDPQGGFLPRRFPPSVEWTPAGRACEQPERRFPANAALFREPPWSEMGVSLPGSLHFQYRFTSRGDGAYAEAVIEARADLDCDGVYSLYRLRITPTDADLPQVENQLE